MQEVRWSCWINNEFSEQLYLYTGSSITVYTQKGEKWFSVERIKLAEPFETYRAFKRYCQNHAINKFETS